MPTGESGTGDEQTQEWEAPPAPVAGELSPRTGWLRMGEAEACLATSRRTISEIVPKLGHENVVRRSKSLYLRAPALIAEYFRARPHLLGIEDAAEEQTERWTRLRGDLAEVELARRRGELLDAKEVRNCWQVVVDQIRALGDSAQRRWGEDAQRMVLEAVERIEAAVASTGGTAPSESGD